MRKVPDRWEKRTRQEGKMDLLFWKVFIQFFKCILHFKYSSAPKGLSNDNGIIPCKKQHLAQSWSLCGHRGLQIAQHWHDSVWYYFSYGSRSQRFDWTRGVEWVLIYSAMTLGLLTLCVTPLRTSSSLRLCWGPCGVVRWFSLTFLERWDKLWDLEEVSNLESPVAGFFSVSINANQWLNKETCRNVLFYAGKIS